MEKLYVIVSVPIVRLSLRKTRRNVSENSLRVIISVSNDPTIQITIVFAKLKEFLGEYKAWRESKCLSKVYRNSSHVATGVGIRVVVVLENI